MAAPPVDHVVLADKGVEALLDFAVLEGKPEHAFGFLVGRLAASRSNATDRSAQFYVSHVFPAPPAAATAGGVADAEGFCAAFLQHLVGGLRVVGFYCVCSTGAGARPAVDLERLSRVVCPRDPTVLLEKTAASHVIKVVLRHGGAHPVLLHC
jgi:hypothetical protein